MAEQQMQVVQGNALPDTRSESGSIFPFSNNNVREALQTQLLNVIEVVGKINDAITAQVPNGRHTDVREALIWMLRREGQSRYSLGQPEDQQLYTDISKFVISVAKLTHNQSETPKARALFILDQVRAVINVDTMPADLGKEVELEPAEADESKSEIGFRVDHIPESIYSDFYKRVTKELIGNNKTLAPYRDADGKERKLLAFENVNEDIKTDKVLATVQNLVLFARDIRDYLPLLYSANQASKVFPGFFSIKGNDAVFLQAVQAIIRGRIDVEVLIRLAEALYNQKLDVTQLDRYVKVADERLQLINKIQTLESELTAERENLAMRSVIHASLEKFASENKANEQLIFEVLRNDSMLYDRLRDLYKIYQFARGRNLQPDDLWKVLDDYRTVDAKLKLQENKNNLNQQLAVLLKLLEDNLLQPDQTFKLLRSLLNDPRTSNLGALADKFVQLERRNSDLSASFRQTLVAMGTLLQAMQAVSKQYSEQVRVFVLAFAGKMEQLTQAWGLPANNALALFAQELTTRFVVGNYFTEVDAKQSITRADTLELTFNRQGLDLSTDAVFLHTASLLRWLERFLVDPRRPGDPEMANLWNQVVNGLHDWQQAVIDTFTKTDIAGQAQPVGAIISSITSAAAKASESMSGPLVKVNKAIVESLDRFKKDLVEQDERLRRRITVLLVNPALGNYVLKINGQDSKQVQAAQDLFKAFVDATRLALLDNKADDANSVEVMAKINGLATEMEKLKLQTQYKDDENKRLKTDYDKLKADYKTTESEKKTAERKISDTESKLSKYSANVQFTLQNNDLVGNVERLLDLYEARRAEFVKAANLVASKATKYQVVLAVNDSLSDHTKAVLDRLSAKADNWQAASDQLRNLSLGKLLSGGYAPTQDLAADFKVVLNEFTRIYDDWKKTDALVTDSANKVLNMALGQDPLETKARTVLTEFSDKYDDWKAASRALSQLSAGRLFKGGHQPTQKLADDVKAVLAEFNRSLDDWIETEKLVFAYASRVPGNINLVQGALLKANADVLLKASDQYRADFEQLSQEEEKWWIQVEDTRYPRGTSLPEVVVNEQKNQALELSRLKTTIDRVTKRHSIVLGWVKSLADLVAENDVLTVKDLINKANGKPSKSAAASASKPAAAPSNPYYRVQFNGEVDTLTGGEVFPVFLPSTPFMRLWLFAREFAGAASNQLGNILEPLAPGLEINDERTLFILRAYQDSKSKNIDNPTLPTGGPRADMARQQLADAEDKQNLKETAEERRKLQEKVALKYIKQLDDYKNLEQYEIKVRQYFKEMAMNALVHCREILQRTDLPDFRNITLAELINSPNLCSGFARMCGLYLLVKQGTVPGMISTQSSAAARVLEFDQHARNLPRMYRRKGKYVWEVVRVPSASDSVNNKRIRL